MAKGSSGGKNYLVGFKELMNNLNVEIGMIQGRGIKGLIQAAREIKKETLVGSPKTPKDVGNLRESWFITTSNGIIDGRSPSFKYNPKRKQTTKILLDESHKSAITESQASLQVLSTKNNPVLTFGYSAPYSGFVHEMVGAKNWTQEGSGAKWLQTAISGKYNTILKIIGDNVRIK
jgi:hypothetical protein